MTQDTTRRFVDEHIKPDIDDHSEASSLPKEPILHMGNLDFNAPDIEGYGSPNVRRFAYEPLIQELEAGDSGVCSMASVQSALVM